MYLLRIKFTSISTFRYCLYTVVVVIAVVVKLCFIKFCVVTCSFYIVCTVCFFRLLHTKAVMQHDKTFAATYAASCYATMQKQNIHINICVYVCTCMQQQLVWANCTCWWLVAKQILMTQCKLAITVAMSLAHIRHMHTHTYSQTSWGQSPKAKKNATFCCYLLAYIFALATWQNSAFYERRAACMYVYVYLIDGMLLHLFVCACICVCATTVFSQAATFDCLLSCCSCSSSAVFAATIVVEHFLLNTP